MNEKIKPLLADALPKSDLIHDRAALQQAITRMAGEIRADYGDQCPVYMPIMNGGMFFASLLALDLDIDIEFDYLHATRYRGETSGGGLHWSRKPDVSLVGKRVLLVDDILDEGRTLLEVRRWCMEQGATDARIAVLAWKRHDRGVPDFTPDYWGLEVPDRWVFGFGMDYYEQGRNLPAIYALKD